MTADDHDHERTAAPMVDEITDFEVLEIALRELCIEKGIFTAEEHRHFTEFARGLALKGSGIDQLWPSLAALTAYTVAVLLLATRRFHRRMG